MIGTIVNTATILLGSVLGGTFKRFLNKKLENALLGALGMAAFGIGISNVVRNMPDSRYPVLFIVSLALGVLCGTLLDIDGRLHRAAAPKAQTEEPSDKAGGRGNLIEGLTTGCLIYCIGALSILGPIEAALRGDHTLLFTNATLDLVTSTVLAVRYLVFEHAVKTTGDPNDHHGKQPRKGISRDETEPGTDRSTHHKRDTGPSHLHEQLCADRKQQCQQNILTDPFFPKQTEHEKRYEGKQVPDPIDQVLFRRTAGPETINQAAHDRMNRCPRPPPHQHDRDDRCTNRDGVELIRKPSDRCIDDQ